MRPSHRTLSPSTVGAMSNLGAYQEITTAAKAAGGVEQMVKAIERGAVWKAAPVILAAGAAAALGVERGIREIVARRRAARAEAKQAKAALSLVGTPEES